MATLVLPNGTCSSEAGEETVMPLIRLLVQVSSCDSRPVQPYHSLAISEIPKSYFFSVEVKDTLST